VEGLADGEATGLAVGEPEGDVDGLFVGLSVGQGTAWHMPSTVLDDSTLHWSLLPSGQSLLDLHSWFSVLEQVVMVAVTGQSGVVSPGGEHDVPALVPPAHWPQPPVTGGGVGPATGAAVATTGAFVGAEVTGTGALVGAEVTGAGVVGGFLLLPPPPAPSFRARVTR
jgi:hypothetical protein